MRRPLPGSLSSASSSSSPPPPRRGGGCLFRGLPLLSEASPAPAGAVRPRGAGNRFRTSGPTGGVEEERSRRAPGERGVGEEGLTEGCGALPSAGSFSSPPTPPKHPLREPESGCSRRCCWRRWGAAVIGRVLGFVFKVEKSKLVGGSAPTNNPQAGGAKPSPLPLFGAWGSDAHSLLAWPDFPPTEWGTGPLGCSYSPTPLRCLWGPTCEVESQELAFG